MGLFSWLFDTKPKGRQVKFLSITKDQKKKFLSDIADLNNLVIEANNLIRGNYPLLDVDDSTTLNLLEEPKTPSGKDPKCPYTLTFDAGYNPGAIYYYKDMTVAGAEFTVWKKRKGITIDTGPNDGNMIVERITLHSLPKGDKKRIYTRQK
ncbi:hypothetical protein [Faecalicoccus pleomorphus]|uniref:hypothetical protein n=1 Tax=Faecalicoccus pleomorphus TaxID=1323 RepID=UPI0019603016|nr:hypothetical protein [Faecalicoccus pleomorphus]MBM6808050.1 hypothetical protein [Faecalicoccus pleomorphus]